MDQISEQERLRRLGERIAALKGEAPGAQSHPDHHAQAQMAWRMVSELVAGLLVGGGIGYGLDALLGTRPWLMVLFVLLGFAAGVKAMLRSARDMQAAPEGTQAADNAAAGNRTAGPAPAQGQREDTRRG